MTLTCSNGTGLSDLYMFSLPFMSSTMWTTTTKQTPIKGETYTIKDSDGFFVKATYNGYNFVCRRGRVRSGSIWYYNDYNALQTPIMSDI